MRWVGHVAHMEEMRNDYKILVEKVEGDLVDCRRILKMDLKEIRFEGVNWIQLAQGRVQ
jgi:hypothetical protein